MRKRRVLLVNPNQMKPPVTPVALDYLAQSLEEKGFLVQVLDLAFSADAEADIQSSLKGGDPLLIGVTVRNLDDSYLASQDFCLERTKGIIDLLKAHSAAPLVLGGVGFSIAPEAVLSYCQVDLGIRGEGEQALPLLAKRIGEGDDFRGVPGLIFKEGRTFRRNRMYWFALEEADLSRREALDNPRYLREGGMVGFESKRGCDQGCAFCADPIAKGRRVRLRPPAQVAQELANLHAQGVDHFHTCDSEFNIPESHALEVCQQIVERGLGDKVPSPSRKSLPNGCGVRDARGSISDWTTAPPPCSRPWAGPTPRRTSARWPAWPRIRAFPCSLTFCWGGRGRRGRASPR